VTSHPKHWVFSFFVSDPEDDPTHFGLSFPTLSAYLHCLVFSLIFPFSIYLLLCLMGIHCGIYESSYKTPLYHTWVYTLHHVPLSTLPHSCFKRFHFSIYMYVYMVFALHSPSQTLSSPPPHTHTLVRTPTGRTCSALLFSNFVKRKKWHFCLFKVATQGVSLQHFQEYM
jgi:hypothetical protein